jgi:hypothetical protein
MSYTYYGDDGAALPTEKSWDPYYGWHAFLKERGTPTYIAGLQAALQAAYTPFTVTAPDESGYQTITIEAGVDGAETDASLWELDGNDLEKTLWSHPKVITELDKVAWGTDPTTKVLKMANLRNAIESLVRGETNYTDSSGAVVVITMDAIHAILTALSASITQSVFDDMIISMCRGAEVWPIGQYVLRHTLIIARSSATTIAYTDVGKMFSSANLVLWETDIPTSILASIPAGYWLKRTPTLKQINSLKLSLVQEWWHSDDYDSFLYEDGGAPA